MTDRLRSARTITVAILAGCTASDSAAPGPLFRDSAGITIVENAPGARAPDGGVHAVLDLEIGAGDSAAVQFAQIVGMDVDAAGRIFVLDQVQRAVYAFGPDGALLGTIGRAGEGPGELSRYVNGLLLRGDTVLVPDWALRRMNRFVPDGTLLGIDTLPLSSGRSTWQNAPDGSLRARVLGMQVDSTGRWVFDDVLVAIDAAGHIDTTLVFDYATTDIGGPQAVKAPLLINAPSWTVLPDLSIAWTALDLAEVRIHGPDGRRTRIIRSDDWVPRAATEADRTHMIGLLRERLIGLGGDPAAIAQLDIPPLPSLPVLTSVLAGSDGTLWVQRAGEPESYHPMSINASEFTHGLGGSTWDVVDAQGVQLATVMLPGRIQVVRVLGDALYGVRRDALGVETVVRLRVDGIPQ